MEGFKIPGKISLNIKTFYKYLGIIKGSTITTVSESTTIRTAKSTKDVITTKDAAVKLPGVIFKQIIYLQCIP